VLLLLLTTVSMAFFTLIRLLVISSLALLTAGAAFGGKPGRFIKPYKRAPLQDIVSGSTTM
jgi:hypothetical protein